MKAPAIVRRPELLRMLGGISTSTLYRWMAADAFPRPIRLGPNLVAWRRESVEQWLDRRPTA